MKRAFARIHHTIPVAGQMLGFPNALDRVWEPFTSFSMTSFEEPVGWAVPTIYRLFHAVGIGGHSPP